MDFSIFHDYQRAERMGLVDPLLCPDDSTPLYVQADDDFEPVLHCYGCGSDTIPGTGLVGRITNALQAI